jgi:putative peptidoglycan binding protein/PGAP1-like protein
MLVKNRSFRTSIATLTLTVLLMSPLASYAFVMDGVYINEMLGEMVLSNRVNENVDWSNPGTGNQGSFIIYPADVETGQSRCFTMEGMTFNADAFIGGEATICINAQGTGWGVLRTRDVPYTKNLVRKIQSHLVRLGYQIGAVDGVAAGGTSEAIRAFQKNSGKTIDGKVTPWIISDLEKTETPVTTTQRTSNPIVLTLDGIDTKMLADVAGTWQKTRGESYLRAPIIGQWDFASQKDTYYVGWSGDLKDTDVTVKNVKSQIKSLASLAETRDRSFIIVAHSWGGILAYRSILELVQEGNLAKGAIDQLVTMGTPLNAQWKGWKFVSRKYDNWQGAVPLDGYVGNWQNYWMKADDISGAIPGLPASNNIELTNLTKDAHGDFWGKSGDLQLLDRIGADLKRSLKTQAKTTIKKTPNVTLTQSIAATAESVTRNDGLCLSGVCLGDTFSKLRNANWKSLEHHQGNLSLDEALNLLAGNDVVCGAGAPIQGEIFASDAGILSIKFGVYPGIAGADQTYEVTTIQRDYELGSNQDKEFSDLVLAKFPTAKYMDQSQRGWRYYERGLFSCAREDPPCVQFRTGSLQLIAPGVNSLKSGGGGQIVELLASDPRFSQHSKCLKPKRSISIE